MKINMNIKVVCLYSGWFLLQNCTAPTQKEAANQNVSKAEYYSVEDFPYVEKYDTHVHINAEDSTFIGQAKKDNFRLLTVNVNSRIPVEEQRRIAIKLTRAFPDRLAF